MRKNKPRIQLTLLALFCVWCTVATAQLGWTVMRDTRTEAGGSIEIAVVSDDYGHSLLIYLDQNSTVRGEFHIRGGFDVLEKRACPTFQVDGWHATRARFEDYSCELGPKQANFSLGELDEKRLLSRGVMQLMNGTTLTFRYRIEGKGYRETEFTLSGSKGALTEILGTDIEIVTQ